jgi:hypothetical protein
MNRLETTRGRREAPALITTRQALSTGSWTKDVETLESTIGRFDAEGSSTNDCEVAFFELDGDGRLHVNVTHRHRTQAVNGWAGPGSVPNGFVHNRTFGRAKRSEIIGHIRDMIFAART